MDKSQQLGIRIGLEGILYLVRINRLAPFVLDHNGLRTTALHVFFHAPTKNTVLTNDSLVTGLKQVNKAAFHTR